MVGFQRGSKEDLDLQAFPPHTCMSVCLQSQVRGIEGREIHVCSGCELPCRDGNPRPRPKATVLLLMPYFLLFLLQLVIT